MILGLPGDFAPWLHSPRDILVRPPVQGCRPGPPEGNPCWLKRAPGTRSRPQAPHVLSRTPAIPTLDARSGLLQTPCPERGESRLPPWVAEDWIVQGIARRSTWADTTPRLHVSGKHARCWPEAYRATSAITPFPFHSPSSVAKERTCGMPTATATSTMSAATVRHFSDTVPDRCLMRSAPPWTPGRPSPLSMPAKLPWRIASGTSFPVLNLYGSIPPGHRSTRSPCASPATTPAGPGW